MDQDQSGILFALLTGERFHKKNNLREKCHTLIYRFHILFIKRPNSGEKLVCVSFIQTKIYNHQVNRRKYTVNILVLKNASNIFYDNKCFNINVFISICNFSEGEYIFDHLLSQIFNGASVTIMIQLGSLTWIIIKSVKME